MKTVQKISMVVMALLLATSALNAQQRILFEGHPNNGEGIAGWNANGAGPEPAATGHLVPAPGFGHHYYYGSSRDFITGDSDDAGFHFLPSMTGFSTFEKVLIMYGFSADQVKVKYGLTSLGEDIEGLDWFFMDNSSYSNYYRIRFSVVLNNEPLLSGTFDYAMMYINTTGGAWTIESGYAPVTNVAMANSVYYEIASAFMKDLDGREIKICHHANYVSSFQGNGRSGAFYTVEKGILTAGNPNLPFIGLNDDYQGFAAWDATGTGPEPIGDGHDNQPYYRASLDYGGIFPFNDACLGHFVQGSSGFFNTRLQLEHRGFKIEELTIKMDLSSLGPDVYGQDWGYDKTQHWCNYYNNSFVIELRGVPIIQIMQDKDRVVDAGQGYTTSKATIGKAYMVPGLSHSILCVAKSMLKDLGNHLLISRLDEINVVPNSNFMGNGRDGAFWEITNGSFVGVSANGTFVPGGKVNGLWTAENAPYYVDGDLKIEAGSALSIEPGVKVLMRGPYKIEVEGRILAKGDCGKEIVFTRSNPVVTWDGFDYFNTHSVSPSIFQMCIFEYSHAQGGGTTNSGGVFAVNHYDKLEIYCSVFRHNKADKGISPGGGAIALRNSSPIIQRCTFHDNFSKYGGAIFAYENSRPVISNCVIYKNTASFGGAINFHTQSGGILINNTIADNKAICGGGLYFANQSHGEIINNIIWNNEAQAAGDQVSFQGNSNRPGFYYNDCKGGINNFGGYFGGEYLYNVDKNPMFRENNAAHPYSISKNSPCINTGTSPFSPYYYTQYLPSCCLCGTARVCNDRIDIGAYECMLNAGIEIPLEPPEMKSGLITCINAYPNPFDETLNYQFTLPEALEVRIEIYDILGKLMFEPDVLQLAKGPQEITKNVADLSEGIYMLMVKYDNAVLTQKLVKTR